MNVAKVVFHLMKTLLLFASFGGVGRAGESGKTRNQGLLGEISIGENGVLLGVFSRHLLTSSLLLSLAAQPCLLQIFVWEQNLEQFQMDLFRYRCYLASLQGGELPNPKRLLAFASRPTKVAMGRLGIFSVSSFHALVSAGAGLGLQGSLITLGSVGVAEVPAATALARAVFVLHVSF